MLSAAAAAYSFLLCCDRNVGRTLFLTCLAMDSLHALVFYVFFTSIINSSSFLLCLAQWFASVTMKWLRLEESSVSIWPNPRPSQATRQGAQHVQAAPEGLQGGDPTTSRHPVPGLRHLPSTEVFLVLEGHLLHSSLCLLPLVLSPGTTEKSLALHLPSGIYKAQMESPQACYKVPTLSAFPHRCFSPLTILTVLHWIL